MKIKLIILVALLSFFSIQAKDYTEWKPIITEDEMIIAPNNWETCYQYAERMVHAMKHKYRDRRIEGSYWLSKYWEYHYYGALNWRNYNWTYN